MVASSRTRSEIFVVDNVNRTTKARAAAMAKIRYTTEVIREKEVSNAFCIDEVLTTDNTSSRSSSFCTYLSFCSSLTLPL